MSKQPNQAVRYVVTGNNAAAHLTDPTELRLWLEENVRVPLEPFTLYGVFQFEVGASGTRHVQGFFRLKKRKRYTQVHEFCPIFKHTDDHPGMELQAAYQYSTDLDNQHYCSKPSGGHPECIQNKPSCSCVNSGTTVAGTLVEWGEPQIPNETDSKAARRHAFNKLILEGASNEELIAYDPSLAISSHRNVVTFREFAGIRVRGAPVVMDESPEVVVYCGPSSSGKSVLARRDHNLPATLASRNLPSTKQSTPWFANYIPGDPLFFEEYSNQDGGQFKLQFLNQICDRFPFEVQFKGGSRIIRPPKIIFTSNYKPQYWYDKSDGRSAESFLRRITEVVVVLGKFDDRIKSWVKPQVITRYRGAELTEFLKDFSGMHYASDD